MGNNSSVEVGAGADVGRASSALELELECDPKQVSVARDFVRQTAAAWGLQRLEWVLQLVASELVTNAFLHARTKVNLRLIAEASGAVRIEVHDDNPRLPFVAAPPDEATSGRGLGVVATVSTSWGSEPLANGKVVWARLGEPTKTTCT